MSAFGKDVHHVYLPYDLPGAMNRFLDTVQPKLVIVMETELWRGWWPLHKAESAGDFSTRLSRRSAVCQTGRHLRPPVERILRLSRAVKVQPFLALGLAEISWQCSSLKFDILRYARAGGARGDAASAMGAAPQRSGLPPTDEVFHHVSQFFSNMIRTGIFTSFSCVIWM